MQRAHILDRSLDWTTAIAAQIRREREGRHLTQVELSLRAGIDRGYVSTLELGKHKLGFEKFMRILEVLDIEPADFFSRIGASRKTLRRARLNPALRRAPGENSYLRILGTAVCFERGYVFQTTLAKQVPMSRSALSALENGIGNPAIELVVRLVEAMGFEPADFFGHLTLNPSFEPHDE